ncbi:MAG: PAS domain-containing protein, partial [Pseudomonadota bacterium]
MRKDNENKDLPLEKLHFNVAIVGGGEICKFFLELLQRDLFPYLDITISGVCDINPEAEGFCLAKKMGIYTTTDFHDLFNIKGLNGILEFTNNRDVLLDLIRLRPKKVGVLEHNIGRLLRSLFIVNQGIQLADKQIELEKDVSNFLMRQSNERIVIIKPDFTIVDANESFLEAVGKPKEMVIGAPCYQVTHRLNAPCSIGQPELGCPLVETLKSGDSACVIHEHPVPDGQPKYCDMVTYPLKNPSGEIVRIIEIWRDITDKIST